LSSFAESEKRRTASLESEQENIDNDFLKQSLQLVVDGVEPEVIVDTMDLELET